MALLAGLKDTHSLMQDRISLVLTLQHPYSATPPHAKPDVEGIWEKGVMESTIYSPPPSLFKLQF